MMFVCVGRKRSQVFGLFTTQTQHPSKLQLVRDVLVVEVLYLLLNSSWPRERYASYSINCRIRFCK
jgi:hypothetical protein